MKRIIIGAVALALPARACGGGEAIKTASTTAVTSGASVNSAAADPKEPAGDAVKRQLGQVDKGQFGPEWDELHPVQQALVPHDLYIQCSQKAGIPQVDNIKVPDTYQEDLTIPGTTVKAPSTAVSVSYTVHQGATSANSKATFHEFSVDGK